MTEKIGCLIIDLQASQISQEERELIAHPLVGGVILFTRNYESPVQLKTLCQQIRATRRQSLLIMVDQEGGRVQRFKSDFTHLPHLGKLGKMYEENSDKALQFAQQAGYVMAVELLSQKIDLSLAPVLDLNKNLNQVIGDRAFHEDPSIVIELAQAFITGMRQAGMAATGKHFPGHGAVTLDSHVALPIDNRDFSTIEKEDLIPFIAMIKQGINAIMTAHIIFKNVDDLPVSFSAFWVQKILRQQLQFAGAIFTDDLNMQGANISSNYADRVQAARQAGCDFTLLCNNRQGVINVLDSLNSDSYLVNYEKWATLKGNFSQKDFGDLQNWQANLNKLTL